MDQFVAEGYAKNCVFGTYRANATRSCTIGRLLGTDRGRALAFVNKRSVSAALFCVRSSKPMLEDTVVARAAQIYIDNEMS